MTKPSLKRTPKDELDLLRRLRGFVEGLVEDQTDKQTVLDTLEGIEDVDKAFGRLVDLSNDLRVFADAKKARAKQYSDAADADLENRKRLARILQLMLIETGQTKWSGLEGGVHKRQGSLSVEITDATMIPFEYLRPVPDIKKIGDAIKELGYIERAAARQLNPNEVEVWILEGIPGARLVRGPETVAVSKPKAASTSTEEG